MQKQTVDQVLDRSSCLSDSLLELTERSIVELTVSTPAAMLFVRVGNGMKGELTGIHQSDGIPELPIREQTGV
jgi:hypothetical protein